MRKKPGGLQSYRKISVWNSKRNRMPVINIKKEAAASAIL